MPSAAPLASVVIPLFQKGPYIRRAVDSVLGQTFGDIEVIVVDDGSTDHGPLIARAIRDSRIHVHSTINRGVSAARNLGTAMARAPWIGFLDADDEWLPGFLETTLSAARSAPDVGVVFSNFRDQQYHRPALHSVEREGIVVSDYFSSVLKNEGFGMSSSSVLVSKASLHACGGFVEGVDHGEDVDLWSRLAWAGAVAFEPEVLAICHSEVADSASKDPRGANIAYPAFLRSFEEWRAAGRIPSRLESSSHRYANWLLARHVMELAHQGMGSKARQRLSHAAWRDPMDPMILKATLWLHLPGILLRGGRRLRAALRRRGARN